MIECPCLELAARSAVRRYSVESDREGYSRCALCGSYLSGQAPIAYDAGYWPARGGLDAHANLLRSDRLDWWIERVCRRPLASSLEIGAAPGVLLDALLERQIDAWGVDPTLQHPRCIPREWPLALDRRFDVVIMLDVLEHVPDPARALRAARACLPEGGRLLVQCPTLRACEPDMEARFWLPGEHQWIPTQEGLTAVLHGCGFAVDRADETWHPGHEWTEAVARG